MSDAVRQNILEALQQSLESRTEPRAPLPGPSPRSAMEWLPLDEPWDFAREMIESLGDELLLASSRQELAQAVARIVAAHDIKSAALWDHPLLKGLDMQGLLSEQGVELMDLGPSRQEGMKPLAQADLGVTSVDALAVGSGSLIMAAGSGLARSTSLVPPVHLALVPANKRVSDFSQLVPMMTAYYDSPGGMPSAVAMVSGHSRTADIELVLISGVHGPKAVYVIGVQEPLLSEAGGE